MSAHEHELPAEDAVRESWRSLKRFYDNEIESNSEYKSDYRFPYIINRLIESETGSRFTVGEAFSLPWHADPDYVGEPDRRSPSDGRALYFTLDSYGTTLSEAPHVAMYIAKNQLMATYCRGDDVITTHICQTRKEIPCLLSLLEMLWRDRDLPRPPSRWEQYSEDESRSEQAS